MDTSSFQSFKELFLYEDQFMKKFQNLLLVPPEQCTGENKSDIFKSFLLQTIFYEEIQRQNFQIVHLSLGFVEIFLSKSNNPHQNLELLQYAAMSLVCKKLADCEVLNLVSRKIECAGISSTELGSMELKIWKSLSFELYFVTFTDFLLAFLNLSPTLTEQLNCTNFEYEIQAFYFSFVQKYGILRFKSSSIFFICIQELLPFYGLDLPNFESNYFSLEIFDKEDIENCYGIVIESLNSFLYSEEAITMTSLEETIELQSDKSEEDDDDKFLCFEKLTFE